MSDRMKEIEETIAILKLAVVKAEGDERDALRDAIAKLKVKKTLLTGTQWDSYRTSITEEDFKTLKLAKETIKDEEREEEEKAEKVKTIVGIAKKITGMLGI